MCSCGAVFHTASLAGCTCGKRGFEASVVIVELTAWRLPKGLNFFARRGDDFVTCSRCFYRRKKGSYENAVFESWPLFVIGNDIASWPRFGGRCFVAMLLRLERCR